MTWQRHGQTNAKDEGTDWSLILEALRASADSFLGAVCLPFPPANSVFHTKMLHGKRRKGRTSVKLGSNLKRLVTKWKSSSIFYFIFTNDDNNVRMKACENGIKMSKVQDEMFSSQPSLLFHRHCLGRARAHRDMLIIEFSSQKECSKSRGKAWFSSGYIGHCIDHV